LEYCRDFLQEILNQIPREARKRNKKKAAAARRRKKKKRRIIHRKDTT